jgi:SNF2 family DNA or RNA helicase
MSEPRDVYDVLYTKDGNKKRKTYHDGTLTRTKKTAGYVVVLQNDSQKEIFRKNIAHASYECGTEVKLGIFDVMIEKENATGEIVAENIPELSNPKTVSQTTKLSGPRKVLCSVHSKGLSAVTLKSKSVGAPRPFSLDESLLRLMHPHQIEGATFLLECLDGKKMDDMLTEDIDSVDDDFILPSKTEPDTQIQQFRGAILADEMGMPCFTNDIFTHGRTSFHPGLGKTLTAISVLWACVKGGRAKGVVVCPSSLVDNWEKEVCTMCPF